MVVEVAIAEAIASPRRLLVGVSASVVVLILILLVVGGGGPVLPGVIPGTSSAVEAGPSSDVEPSPWPDGMRRYRVRAGDTLRTIADRFGISVRQLRSANDLGDPPRLEPGDVMLVPPPG